MASSPAAVCHTPGNAPPYATTITSDAAGLTFVSNDVGKPRTQNSLPNIWLRDNCPCNECVNQATMQRNLDSFELSQDIKAKLVSCNRDGFQVLWSDSHKSNYTWQWLRSIFPDKDNTSFSNQGVQQPWDSGSILTNLPEITFEDIMQTNDEIGMAHLTNKIRLHGFCFVVDTPPTPDATKSLLERIGPIRETHYGGLYDFTPNLAKADTAYTNLALAAHTDTTYFTDPAGHQALHLLSHAPPPGAPSDQGDLGGHSLLVDGLYAARRLETESPDDYDVLRKTRVPWHASGNEGVAIAPDKAYPVIETHGGVIQRIRWNNNDRGYIPPDSSVVEWYNAARKWRNILSSSEGQYRFQLKPGRVLIFDNWRVLHGRTAFEGTRRMCGAYINRDDFISRWKMANFPREDVILANMQLKYMS